jgi:hypothetical protein
MIKTVSNGETHAFLQSRDARWFVFKPKIPNLGKFWRAFEW